MYVLSLNAQKYKVVKIHVFEGLTLHKLMKPQQSGLLQPKKCNLYFTHCHAVEGLNQQTILRLLDVTWIYPSTTYFQPRPNFNHTYREANEISQVHCQCFFFFKLGFGIKLCRHSAEINILAQVSLPPYE